MLGLVLTAGVSVTVSGFVGAKGSVGMTMLGRLIFREEIAVLPGSHRPVQQQGCINGSLVLQCRRSTWALAAGSNSVVSLTGG